MTTTNLARSQILALCSYDWVRRHEHCIITSATGVGKSFLGCAVANKARREGLDDWGIAPFSDELRRDMLEILDDRFGRRSTLVAAQVPIEKWHEVIADPTLADAILDRLVHNAHKLTLKGESMRKLRGVTDFNRLSVRFQKGSRPFCVG